MKQHDLSAWSTNLLSACHLPIIKGHIMIIVSYVLFVMGGHAVTGFAPSTLKFSVTPLVFETMVLVPKSTKIRAGHSMGFTLPQWS